MIESPSPLRYPAAAAVTDITNFARSPTPDFALICKTWGRSGKLRRNANHRHHANPFAPLIDCPTPLVLAALLQLSLRAKTAKFAAAYN